MIRAVLAVAAVAASAGLGWGATRDGVVEDQVRARAREATAQSCCPYYDYDGTWRFVRIQTNSPWSGYGGRGGWSHDYPASDRNLSTILREYTYVRTRDFPYGGNVLRFDDPRLMQYPFAYVSEPGDWQITNREAEGLREYLEKGGFVIFDDFFVQEMQNLVRQMSVAVPELTFMRMDGGEEVWDSFFRLDALGIYLTGPRKYGTPQFWALYEDNDPTKRLLGIANAGADVGDLWEWAAEGFYGVDPTNEAFRMGLNYVVFSMTH